MTLVSGDRQIAPSRGGRQQRDRAGPDPQPLSATGLEHILARVSASRAAFWLTAPRTGAEPSSNLYIV
jgi:hypothetical protein